MPAHKTLKSICLYCGSSNAVNPDFLKGAHDFGALLASQDLRLVYGGGGVGLMGAAARSAHTHNGRVLGVMPKFLRSREFLYDDVETVVVDNMHERKMMMFEQSDAFVVMPGGIGTLEEVVELMSWRRLDLHKKPIVFWNMHGFWNLFDQLIEHTMAEKFSPDNFKLSYAMVNELDQIIPKIKQMIDDDITLDTRRNG